MTLQEIQIIIEDYAIQSKKFLDVIENRAGIENIKTLAESETNTKGREHKVYSADEVGDIYTYIDENDETHISYINREKYEYILDEVNLREGNETNIILSGLLTNNTSSNLTNIEPLGEFMNITKPGDGSARYGYSFEELISNFTKIENGLTITETEAGQFSVLFDTAQVDMDFNFFIILQDHNENTYYQDIPFSNSQKLRKKIYNVSETGFDFEVLSNNKKTSYLIKNLKILVCRGY